MSFAACMARTAEFMGLGLRVNEYPWGTAGPTPVNVYFKVRLRAMYLSYTYYPNYSFVGAIPKI